MEAPAVPFLLPIGHLLAGLRLPRRMVGAVAPLAGLALSSPDPVAARL